MRQFTRCASLLFFIFSSTSIAEMARIADDELAGVTGQSGVYLSGEISINENGGPLTNSFFGACSDPGKECGARLSFQTEQDGGWFVLADIKGTIAFEGLTLQVREISSGFGGDGALFNRDVMEIGLPESLRMNDFQFTLATTNNARPGDVNVLPGNVGFEQIDLLTVEMSGDVTLDGNLLIFPTR